MEGTIKYPRMIYYKGDPSILEKPSVAVIGTRHPSEKGSTACYRMTRRICEMTDFQITTGLAIGCDTIAARAALDAGRPVIAVLPSGTSNIYPKGNIRLAEEIVDKGGCLVSEYAPDESAYKWRFIARDKLMAEIASAVIVVQCGESSGTMHTVKAARELGKKLGCWIPANPDIGDFGGNHLMVADYGATGIQSITELIGFLDAI